MRVVLPIFAGLSASCATIGPPASVLPLAIATGGDDGLTQRLVDAVRGEFARSGRFRLSNEPDAVVVTIPTNVSWERFGGRTLIKYQVIVEGPDRRLARSQGACWEGELKVCARAIVNATAIARQSHR